MPTECLVAVIVLAIFIFGLCIACIVVAGRTNEYIERKW